MTEQESVFDERYIEALVHQRSHRVLGKRLKPFSIWHRTQFEAFGLPFFSEPELATPHDLRIAVAICQTQFPDLLKIPNLSGIRRKWMRIVDLTRFGQGTFHRELGKLYCYFADYYSCPIVENIKDGDSVREPDMDEALSVVANYRACTNCPREEPWNLPIGELYWMHVTLSRQKGAEFSIRTTVIDQAIVEAKKSIQAKKEKQ